MDESSSGSSNNMESIESMVRSFDRELRLFEEAHLAPPALPSPPASPLPRARQEVDVPLSPSPYKATHPSEHSSDLYQPYDSFTASTGAYAGSPLSHHSPHHQAFASPSPAAAAAAYAVPSPSLIPRSPPYFSNSALASVTSSSRADQAVASASFSMTPEHSFELAAAESEREQLHDRLNDLQCRVEELEAYTRYQDDFIERLKRRNGSLESRLRQTEAKLAQQGQLSGAGGGGGGPQFGEDVGHRLDMYRMRLNLLELELEEARDLLKVSRLDQEATRTSLATSETRREEEAVRRILAEKQRDAYVAAYEEALAHIEKLGVAEQAAQQQLHLQQQQLDSSRGSGGEGGGAEEGGGSGTTDATTTGEGSSSSSSEGTSDASSTATAAAVVADDQSASSSSTSSSYTSSLSNLLGYASSALSAVY